MFNRMVVKYIQQNISGIQQLDYLPFVVTDLVDESGNSDFEASCKISTLKI